MNKVILLGRLTKDPELRYSNNGQQTAVCRYSLAVNRSYKREGEADADFINIIAFGNRAEFASKYFKKGQMVAISGEIRTGSYTDKNGEKRYTTDVIATDQYFAGGNSVNGNATGSANRNGDFAPMQEAAPREFTNPTYTGTQSGMGDGFMPIDGEIDGDGDLPF